jgi:ZIP family zinc transporter
MSVTERVDLGGSVGRTSYIGVGATILLLALSALAATGGYWKVLVIAWVAFLAMAGAAVLGARAETDSPYRLVWGYGIASGAMIASAAMFLVPQAIGLDPRLGGAGIAAGIVVGFGAHTIGHRLGHREFPMDDTAVQITAHALSAGAIIGIIYGALPGLGLLLGLSIVSHKGPAGYAAARRLRRMGKPPSVLLLPAAGVGLTAVPAAMLAVPLAGTVNAVVFGFAAGVFLHVAMDFLPSCEVGGEVDEVASVSDADHALLDRLRVHAVASTALGGLAVFLAWVAIV